jgi:hypothetical protein
MVSNPYQPPLETPPAKRRRIRLPWIMLPAALAAALVLVFFEAPRWMIVAAGGAAALAADALITKGNQE